MKVIRNGTVFDTKKAHPLLHAEWYTRHPNQAGGDPMLRHECGVYRGNGGTVFGARYDQSGYGRDENGVTGLYTRSHSDVVPFYGEVAENIVRWCEEQDCFDIDAIIEAFPEGVKEA